MAPSHSGWWTCRPAWTQGGRRAWSGGLRRVEAAGVWDAGPLVPSLSLQAVHSYHGGGPLPAACPREGPSVTAGPPAPGETGACRQRSQRAEGREPGPSPTIMAMSTLGWVDGSRPGSRQGGLEPCAVSQHRWGNQGSRRGERTGPHRALGPAGGSRLTWRWPWPWRSQPWPGCMTATWALGAGAAGGWGPATPSCQRVCPPWPLRWVGWCGRIVAGPGDGPVGGDGSPACPGGLPRCLRGLCGKYRVNK